jgi:hypothetical protein
MLRNQEKNKSVLEQGRENGISNNNPSNGIDLENKENNSDNQVLDNSQNKVDNGLKGKDYNFAIPNSHIKKLKVDPNTLKVEKFLVSQYFSHELNYNTKRKHTQLSDHYGLSCEIVYQSTNLLIYFLEPEENLEDRDSGENSFNVDDRLNEEQKNLLDNI